MHDPNLFDAHGNSLCDHYSIQAVLSLGKPKHPVKEITFRKWKNVDLGELSKDITLDIPNDNSFISQIVDHYNTTIHNAVEKHAPLKKKYVLLRPNTKWYSEEHRDAKRERRRAERLRRKTRLEIHRQIFRDTSSKTAKLLYKTKQDYFSQRIEECGKDNKQLFKLSKSLMGKNRKLFYRLHHPIRSWQMSFLNSLSIK